MRFKKIWFSKFLLGGILLIGNTPLMAASTYSSYPFDADDFKSRPYFITVPERLMPAFQPVTQENNLDGRNLIRLHEISAGSPPSLSVFKESLQQTHRLDLADQDFTENPAVWDALCKSEDLSVLRTLNVSRSRYSDDSDVNTFLVAFLRNSSLSSLIKIQAVNTNISLDTLQEVKNMNAEPYFIRDMEQISGRYNQSVAVIRVEIRGSTLGQDQWQDLRNLERPGREVAVCYRAYPSEIAKAYLKLEIDP